MIKLIQGRTRRAASWFATVLALTACSPSDGPFKSIDISRVEWGGDFALTAHTGQRLGTETLRGKVVAIFFGYTHCPDVCAPTLTKLALARKALGEDAKQVQVLMVTVDPTHDSVGTLAKYVPTFDDTFIGLTGTPAEIAAVASEHKVAYQENKSAPHGAVLIDHSGGILVKDSGGKLRLLMKNEVTVDDMAHDLRRLVREKRP